MSSSHSAEAAELLRHPGPRQRGVGALVDGIPHRVPADHVAHGIERLAALSGLQLRQRRRRRRRGHGAPSPTLRRGVAPNATASEQSRHLLEIVAQAGEAALRAARAADRNSPAARTQLAAQPDRHGTSPTAPAPLPPAPRRRGADASRSVRRTFRRSSIRPRARLHPVASARVQHSQKRRPHSPSFTVDQLSRRASVSGWL